MLAPLVLAVASAVTSGSSSASAEVDEGPPADPNKMHADPSPPVAAEPARSIELWTDGCFASWPSGGYAKVECPAELAGGATGSTFFREEDGVCYVHRGEEAVRRKARCPDVLVDKAQPGVAPNPTAGSAVRCGRCAMGPTEMRAGEGAAMAGVALFVAMAVTRRRARR